MVILAYIVLCNIYKLIIIINLVIILGNQFNYNKLIPNTNSYFKKVYILIFNFRKILLLSNDSGQFQSRVIVDKFLERDTHDSLHKFF